MTETSKAVRAWREQLTPVHVEGLRTFVLDTGAGQPVLFLHGIPTQAFVWRDVARVVETEHRVVAPDLLGFGFADRPIVEDLSPVSQATFVLHALDVLGVDRFALTVHDFGALVGAEILSRSPERVTHLVVSNTSLSREGWGGGELTPFRFLKLRGVGELAFAMARPFMLRQAFRIYVENDDRLTDDVMDVYWHPFQDGFGRVLLSIARDQHHQMSDSNFHRWRQAISDFPNPTLVVWGAKDPTFRTPLAHAIASLAPAGHMEVFDHSNHFVQEDRPEALGRLILAFLGGRYPE